MVICEQRLWFLSLLYPREAVRLVVAIEKEFVRRTEERTEHVVPSFFFFARRPKPERLISFFLLVYSFAGSMSKACET